MRVLLSFVAIFAISSTAIYASSEQNNNTTQEAKEQKEYEVIIRGVKQLDIDELYSIIGATTKKWFEFWKSNKHLIKESLIPSISDTLRGYLDSKGYYDATYTIKQNGDKIYIDITENTPIKVTKIDIDSNYPIDELITFKTGDIFETSKFTDIKSTIKDRLLKDGYCSYNLDTKAYVDLEKKSVNLVYKLDKGDLCHFGDTKIVEKPDSIPERVIKSRLRYKKGDIFTSQKINDTYTALNQLGVFGRTIINTDRKIFNVVEPQIYTSLKDKLHRYVIAAGYDSEVGMRAKATYNHYNFLGGARDLKLSAEYSSKVTKVEANFMQPALLDIKSRYFDLFAKGGYIKEEYDTYDGKNTYLDVKLRHETDTISLDMGISLQNIEIDKKGDDESIIGGSFLMLYPYAKFVLDKRDSKLDPKNGYYLSLYTEYGLPFDEEASNYLKYVVEGRYIKSFDKLTVAGVGKFGAIDDSAGVLPASKYFYAGGSFSNRAYGNRAIGTTLSPTSDSSLGGRTWLNFSTEADYQLMDKVATAVFYDATMIAKDTYDFNAPWIESAGVGIRYSTPMGPIKADFAVNIHKPSVNRISFMIGQSF